MTAAARLPAHLEVSGLVRSVNAAGGFATVLHTGDREAGTILVLTIEKGQPIAFWEIAPRLDGARIYSKLLLQALETERDFSDYWRSRTGRDPDLWVVEIDVPFSERFIETREP